MKTDTAAWLIYDGDCPFCSAYVRLLKLREAVGKVELLNARDGGPLVEDLRIAKFNLDDGMALIIGGRVYHGKDCIQALALMSTESGVFNRVNAAVFRSQTRARFIYPILKAGRNLTLWLMGRKRFSANRE